MGSCYLHDQVGLQLAYVKKSVARFIAAEVIVFGGAFLGFCLLRRSERTREFLYHHTPAVADLYYWAEDSVSFGQLTGTRLKRSDLNRWLSSCFASYVIFEEWRRWRPSPEMPVQSWEKYVRIQKEAKKHI
uniref:Uncharacterized protein n=1 Tax=Ascaris lumbricoides TaxID=6252 RepID=A0A0M3HTL9_ASCLU